jgi:two-component system nitrogen regulation response regulator GlnG
MPFDLQTRLLRVLSDGHYYRVGGHSAIKSQVRVIAATHQDLEARVKAGSFREDLFHRLNVIRLRLPSLRERKEDIALLTKHFLASSGAQLGVEAKRISEDALALLSQFDFPGNVRQLENICHWLTVMAPAQVIGAKDLPPEVLQALEGLKPALNPQPTLPQSMNQHASSFVASDIDKSKGAVQFQSKSSAQEPSNSLAAPSAQQSASAWAQALRDEAKTLLDADQADVWDKLIQSAERELILTALAHTKGRRIEAAQKLGIGRNTITRKIQELGLE